MQYRDIIQKQESKFEKKQDKKGYIKAVITDALGNTTGAGSIWYDRNTRRIWIQEAGSASLSQVPCYKITPAIGLGVIVGFEPYSTVREVLATDREFYGPTNSTGTSYEAPNNEDFLPGGRLQLWLDTRLLQPLAVYPDASGLIINVVTGDYPYSGTRKTFLGQVSYDISAYQPAGPGEHCLVGLYLDSSNSLQVVAGSTVSTAVTAPEPTWLAGAFRLAVIDLDDLQTSIDFSADIQDRRMAWSDTDILGVPLTGAIITGDTTPAWAVLPRGTSGQYVTPNSTTGELEWRDIPTVGITEFLYDVASDIATYFQLKPDIPTGAAQTIVSAAVSASNTLVFNLATNANNPGVEFINDGVWHWHFHAQKSGPGTKDVTLKFRVYYRTDPGGVETQIGTGYSHSTENLTTSEAEYDLHLALDEIAVSLTDRIVLKVYADVSGAGSNPTITLTVEGTTDSRLEIPALTSGGGGWPFDAYTVDSGGTADYTTIAGALAASPAKPIVVFEGTYTEGGLDCRGRSLIALGTVVITNTVNNYGLLIDRDTNLIGRFEITTTRSDAGNVVAGVKYASTSVSGGSLNFDNLYASAGNSAGGGAAGWWFASDSVGSIFVTMSQCYGAGTSFGGPDYSILVESPTAITVQFGQYPNLIRVDHASASVQLTNPILGSSPVLATGVLEGNYADSNGNLIFVPGSGESGGVWLNKTSGLRTKYTTVQAAIDAMSAGDTITVSAGTDTGGIVPDTAGAIVGLSAVESIITKSDNDSITVDNSAGTDNLTLENLTVANTGAGTSVSCVQSNKDGLKLNELIINKISGTPTNATGVSIYGGSGTGTYLRNCKISVTTGTNKYGVYLSTGAANCVIEGGEISAATADIYVGHASAVVELRGVKLLGGGINNASSGTVKGWYLDVNDNVWVGIGGNVFSPIKVPAVNLLYHSMHFNDWQEGTTFNDIGDATTYAGNLWLAVQNGQAPDITTVAGGATDDYSLGLTCTFDSAASQAGFVQFLNNQDTIGLRGKILSLSADLWGTNVSNLAMNVLIWTSTADSPTKDVVATWNDGSAHTLAANWAFGVTSTAIAITSTKTRYKTQNIPIPTNATNIAVFISTWNNEASTDVFNFANVQLEIGPVSTAFVARDIKDEKAQVYNWIEVIGGEDASQYLGFGQCYANNAGVCFMPFGSIKWKIPAITISTAGDFAISNASGARVTATSISFPQITRYNSSVSIGVAATPLVAGNAGIFLANATTNMRVYISARL